MKPTWQTARRSVLIAAPACLLIHTAERRNHTVTLQLQIGVLVCIRHSLSAPRHAFSRGHETNIKGLGNAAGKQRTDIDQIY